MFNLLITGKLHRGLGGNFQNAHSISTPQRPDATFIDHVAKTTDEPRPMICTVNLEEAHNLLLFPAL